MTFQQYKGQGRRGAFTLVELLVVIGIIAILIAILLPTLSNARKQASRVACASNMRQMGIINVMYADMFHGFVPIATRSQNKQSDYWFNAGEGRLTQFGFYYYANLLNASPSVAFCPVETNTLHTFNTPPSNPWPPTDSGPKVRAGYSMRADFRMQWISGGFSSSGLPVYNLKVDRFLTSNPATFQINVAMPKMRDFKNKAIMTDVLRSANDMLNLGHGNGYNVLRSDGSVRFCRKEFVTAQLKLLSETDDAFVAANNVPIDAIWSVFDSF